MCAADAGPSREPVPPLAILTALPEESRPLRRGMAKARSLPGASFGLWEGEIAGRPVLLAEGGSGPRAAEEAAREVFLRFRPAAWVGAGFAGALSPGLERGAIVVAAELAGGGGTATAAISLDSAMAGRALAAAPGARAVRGVASSRIVASPAEKARLLAQAGGSLPVIVDMESAAWAACAAGIPGVIVRVVTDALEDEIPGFVAESVGPGGAIDRGRLLRHAATHPSSIGKLLDLRRRASFCGERLAGFLLDFAARGF